MQGSAVRACDQSSLNERSSCPLKPFYTATRAQLTHNTEKTRIYANKNFKKKNKYLHLLPNSKDLKSELFLESPEEKHEENFGIGADKHNAWMYGTMGSKKASRTS